ncbi:hypothetical protein NE237_002120 [Protea cynaroides]|uniref:Uncharacterized protein n=1 Tax=Protea cynaroides TaxID=273540 RepID=A0A9Q0KUU2_9MAGN|nr:hypothetical protein NE237_002120 [Protea cynaroides]
MSLAVIQSMPNLGKSVRPLDYTPSQPLIQSRPSTSRFARLTIVPTSLSLQNNFDLLGNPNAWLNENPKSTIHIENPTETPIEHPPPATTLSSNPLSVLLASIRDLSMVAKPDDMSGLWSNLSPLGSPSSFALSLFPSVPFSQRVRGKVTQTSKVASSARTAVAYEIRLGFSDGFFWLVACGVVHCLLGFGVVWPPSRFHAYIVSLAFANSIARAYRFGLGFYFFYPTNAPPPPSCFKSCSIRHGEGFAAYSFASSLRSLPHTLSFVSSTSRRRQLSAITKNLETRRFEIESPSFSSKDPRTS